MSDSTRIGERQLALLIDGDNFHGVSWESVFENASRWGRVSIARLYRDFQSLRDGGLAARSAGLEPIHVLGKRSSSGFKSMVDVHLAVDAIKILFENPHLDGIILGTGDADFMPVIRQWKRHGKRAMIMAHEHRVAGELFKVADEVLTFTPQSKGGKKKAPTKAKDPVDRHKLRELLMVWGGQTRLFDRDTDEPVARAAWLAEELERQIPGARAAGWDKEKIHRYILENIPEWEPLDGSSRSYLIGTPKESPGSENAVLQDGMTESDIFDIFAELCREVLPRDGGWVSSATALNEALRLLDEGTELELPAKRRSGWFSNLMSECEGVEVKHQENGHMLLRRVPLR